MSGTVITRYGEKCRLVAALAGGGVAAVILFSGCSSTVRYTRESNAVRQTPGTATQYRVPANWDYRKHYTVPRNRLAQVAATYLGIPYRFGGMSRRGVDCSGLVCLIYKEINRAKLPHSTRRLRTLGRKVAKHKALSGDLVFFRRGSLGRVNHVGIYLGDETFIHASTRRGVIYSKLSEPYYKARFVEIRRIFQ